MLFPSPPGEEGKILWPQLKGRSEPVLQAALLLIVLYQVCQESLTKAKIPAALSLGSNLPPPHWENLSSWLQHCLS